MDLISLRHKLLKKGEGEVKVEQRLFYHTANDVSKKTSDVVITLK